MFGVYDVANKILYHVYETMEEAQEDADIRNACPPPRRRLPRPAPRYEVVPVVEDGYENMVVGFRKHYKVLEKGEAK